MSAWVRWIGLCLLAGLVLDLASPGASCAGGQPPAVTYTITPVFRGDALHALLIDLQFVDDGSGTTTLALPEAWHGEGPASDLKILSTTGTSAVSPIRGGTLVVSARPHSQVDVRYLALPGVDHEPTANDRFPFRTWIRPTWFYAVGHTVFIIPEGRDDAPAELRWAEVPAGFPSISSIDAYSDGRTHVGDLTQSVLIGGRGLRVLRSGSIRLAVTGTFALSDRALLSETTAIIRGERAFWGDDQRTPFLVAVAPLTVRPGYTTDQGEGLRNAFALTLTPNFSLADIRHLIAHEEFHTWNPQQLGGYGSGVPAAQAVEAWFAEGFTEFYARRLLARAHLYTPYDFARDWNDMLLAYATSAARGAPKAEVGARFWSDTDVRDIVYDRGAMLAAIWDARLRRQSSGRVALDDLMLEQRRRAAADSKPSAVELFTQLMAANGLDISADLSRYIDRGDPVSLPPDVFGPCLSVETAEQPTFDVGFDWRATFAGGGLVRGLQADGPAYAAGLREGMVVVRKVAGDSGDSTVAYVLLVRDQSGGQRLLTYLPAGRVAMSTQRVEPTALGRTDAADCEEALGGEAGLSANSRPSRRAVLTPALPFNRLRIGSRARNSRRPEILLLGSAP
jgi:predicted metalloprotease with PDZ domain